MNLIGAQGFMGNKSYRSYKTYKTYKIYLFLKNNDTAIAMPIAMTILRTVR